MFFFSQIKITTESFELNFKLCLHTEHLHTCIHTYMHACKENSIDSKGKRFCFISFSQSLTKLYTEQLSRSTLAMDILSKFRFISNYKQQFIRKKKSAAFLQIFEIKMIIDVIELIFIWRFDIDTV